jgi:predicted N-acetyltransferase YhbS
MSIREATTGDAEQIGALHADSWRRTYRGLMSEAVLGPALLDERIAVWRDRLANDRKRHTLIAEGAFISVVRDEEYGHLIDNLHVGADRQGSGLGRRLMRLGATWLHEQQADMPVYLWVLDGNHRAARFYERLGARHQRLRRDDGLVGETLLEHQYRWPTSSALIAAVDAIDGSHRG